MLANNSCQIKKTITNTNSKSIPILIYNDEVNIINDKTSPNNKHTKTYDNFELKTNLFDPSKFSPPNEFMMKLYMRMNNYYDNNKAIFVTK